MKVMRHISPRLKMHRAALRKDPPEPERILWQRLRGAQLGVKFRRQHSIGSHILDFYAPAVRLAIECDGESHFESDQARADDAARDAALAAEGVVTLRFTNEEIMRNIEGVCMRIQEVVTQRSKHPLSLPL